MQKNNIIILFGAKGYIGSEFESQLKKLNIPIFCWSNSKGCTFKDLQKWSEALKFNFPEIKIAAAINAAGYVGKPNVDACEKNKNETLLGNVVWPQILTDWCIANDIPLAHISSGCIYQGHRADGKPFTEEDEPNFSFKDSKCSFYSGTKALAEKIVSKFEKSYILRLRIPFDENNNERNFISKMIRYEEILKSENSISNKHDFVRASISLILKKADYGIYNIVNSGVLSTDELVKKLKATICKGKKFKLINEKQLYERHASAIRSNCVLDNAKLLATGFKIQNVHDSLNYCLKNWKQ